MSVLSLVRESLGLFSYWLEVACVCSIIGQRDPMFSFIFVRGSMCLLLIKGAVSHLN